MDQIYAHLIPIPYGPWNQNTAIIQKKNNNFDVGVVQKYVTWSFLLLFSLPPLKKFDWDLEK